MQTTPVFFVPGSWSLTARSIRTVRQYCLTTSDSGNSVQRVQTKRLFDCPIVFRALVKNRSVGRVGNTFRNFVFSLIRSSCAIRRYDSRALDGQTVAANTMAGTAVGDSGERIARERSWSMEMAIMLLLRRTHNATVGLGWEKKWHDYKHRRAGATMTPGPENSNASYLRPPSIHCPFQFFSSSPPPPTPTHHPTHTPLGSLVRRSIALHLRDLPYDTDHAIYYFVSPSAFPKPYCHTYVSSVFYDHGCPSPLKRFKWFFRLLQTFHWSFSFIWNLCCLVEYVSVNMLVQHTHTHWPYAWREKKLCPDHSNNTDLVNIHLTSGTHSYSWLLCAFCQKPCRYLNTVIAITMYRTVKIR